MELRWKIERRWILWSWSVEKPVLQYRVYERGRVDGNSDGWGEWKTVPFKWVTVDKHGEHEEGW